MPKPLRVALLALAIATIAQVSEATAQTAPEGRVNFAKAAESSFDKYTLSPSSTQQQWMRDHYWRMRTYPPYFDTRTAWYPSAWAYKDAYAIYPGSSIVSQHPDWILKDAAGNRLYIPYACNGTSCTQYAADIGNPEWRRYYIDAAKAHIARGYKGIFVDDVNFAFNVGNGAGNLVAPRDPRTGTTMTHEAWQRYFAEFMEQLRAELPAQAEIVQNQVYFHVGLSSPYVKRAIEASTHIEIERGVNDTGIRGGSGQFGFETVLAWADYAHSRGKGVVWDVQTTWGREYALATYFLLSNGKDGIGFDMGGLPDDWWSGWNTDLGAPLGGRYLWNGVFRRDFERGSVFVNQPDQTTKTLTPGGTWTRLDGSAVSSVSLPAREGVVLMRQGSNPPPPPPPPPGDSGTGLTDLATGKPTSASSSYHSVYSPDKAVDRSTGTRYSSAFADGQWWQVDLGALRSVSKVEIAWEAAYASSYKILTSKDGVRWSEAASVSLASASTKVTTFAARNARYVRVVGVKRATRYGISFWEVKVWGLSAPATAAEDPVDEEPVEPPADPPADPAADPPTTDTGAGQGPATGEGGATPPPTPGTGPRRTRGLRKRGADRCRRAGRNRAKQSGRSKPRCAKKRKAKRRS